MSKALEYAYWLVENGRAAVAPVDRCPTKPDGRSILEVEGQVEVRGEMETRIKARFVTFGDKWYRVEIPNWDVVQ